MQDSGRATLAERLRNATRENMVQVAPGKWAPRDPTIPVSDLTLARWKQCGEGIWSLVPCKEPMVRLDCHLAALLGFPGRQWSTLKRLAKAGFIETVKLAPGTTMLNLDSYYGLLRRCAEDPDFWRRDGKNFKAYVKAIG